MQCVIRSHFCSATQLTINIRCNRETHLSIFSPFVQENLTSFWAIPILSLQCISTISAFSLANFSTSLAALPAIRCHSGTLFRFSWSCAKQICMSSTSCRSFCRSVYMMCFSRYRGNFQVVTDVHSIHIFLWN